MYAYTEAAFGPFPGFVIGAVHWFAAGVVASASVANALATANIRGVRVAARLIDAPLLLLACGGLFLLQPANLAWSGAPTLSAAGQSALLVIFAFAGTEVVVTPGGEIRNPARTLPRAVLLALSLATVLYLALQVTAQGVLGSQLARETNAPLAATAERRSRRRQNGSSEAAGGCCCCWPVRSRCWAT